VNQYWAAGLIVGVSLVGCASEEPEKLTTAQRHQPIVAGAGYTTFDDALGGCLNGANPNGINCNAYDRKEHVFMSGGPNHPTNGLSDGSYFFAVLTPGSQLAGFLDGSAGNLSDTTVGGTAGDNGSGDLVGNRTFTVASHQILTYDGTHALGTTPNGRTAIGLFPFDDTDNHGGVYILAICATGATDPSQCKYDAFRIKAGDDPTPQFPLVHGGKYYDANLNGQWDGGEVGIANWQIDYHDLISGTIETGPDGLFTLELIPDTYTFDEKNPTNETVLPNGGAIHAWFQTGNTVDQTSTTGGATATLEADMTYSISVDDNQTVCGLYFGNICIGAAGGHTLGYWSNKNGQSQIGSDDLSMLRTLHLRNFSGTDFDPGSKTTYRTWLLDANAINMAYMLSAQLSASALNVHNGLVSASAMIYAPGTSSASSLGFARLGDVIAEADAALAANGVVLSDSPVREYQTALKNALDNSNNDKNYVQASPATCPTATF
jgi:hypothetical protein